ncbi:MAG: beta-lactamase family protein [Candidatus Nanopelagicaceae bacterium]|nr:beta-lactamase family protein [Candidatus Nanopelagicaceae bacterium]
MTSAVAISQISAGNVASQVRGFTSEFGVADPTPINEVSSFDLASITKVLCTTTLVMCAIEEKLLKLDDPISRYLPEWKVEDKKDLTVEDLLRHESGTEEWRPFYISCSTPEQVNQKIANLPLKYPKQKEFHYSDLNFITLGILLRKLYDADLNQIFAARVATPLALENTVFSRPADPKNVVATSIGDSIEKKMVESKQPYPVPEKVEDFAGWRDYILSGEINDGNAFHIFNGESGHAGLFSSLSDLNKFVLGLLDGFLPIERLQQFSKPRNNPVQGIGFRRFPLAQGGFAIGHFGFTGTGFAVDLESKKGWVYLSNRIHTKGEYKTMNEIWSEEFKEFSFPG